MVINEKLKLLFLIDEKIFNIYTKIKEKMYDDKKIDNEIEKLKILIKLEKEELDKLNLDYYDIENLKNSLLEKNSYFNDWNSEKFLLMNQISSNQFNNIIGKSIYQYDENSKIEFIKFRMYQKLNLLQTKCLNYPFSTIDDVINNEEFCYIDYENIYIEDVEKLSGIYTNKDYGLIDYYEYIEKALKDEYVLALDSGFRERLFLEIKADYYLNCYEINNIDKEKNLEIRNFYIDDMINMLYIVPLLEERLLKNDLNIENKEEYMSYNLYKNKNNLRFLDIIRKREFINNCDNFLKCYIYYDNYVISNYYSHYKNSNIITEFANINIIISNIKACFINETRNNLLFSVYEFMKVNKDEDNNKLFNMLMESIGEQEKTFKLK